MQFANQAVSLFISGLFCLVWLGLLAGPLLDPSMLVEALKWIVEKKASGALGAFSALGFSFLVAPLAYALGNAVNALANKQFGRMDKRIRCRVIRDETTWEEIKTHLQKADADSSFSPENYQNIKCVEKENEYGLFSKIAQAHYHHIRFRIYASNAELFTYLQFHREIIRILRAVCFNFFMIFAALFTVTGNAPLMVFGYAMAAGILANILFVKKPPWIDIFSYLFEKWRRCGIILFSITVCGLLFQTSLVKSALLLYAFPFTLFIAFICLVAWEKQQEDFYRTLIAAERAL